MKHKTPNHNHDISRIENHRDKTSCIYEERGNQYTLLKNVHKLESDRWNNKGNDAEENAIVNQV